MGWKPKLMRFLRWGLLLIVLSLAYLGTGLLSAREFTWWIVPALTLVTTTAVFVAKKAGPSPRASIVLAGAGVILVALMALAVMETPGRYVLCATVGCLLGLAIGTIISTTRGPERSKVVRALRWALFLLVAAFAQGLWDFAAKLLLSPVSPAWLNWAVVALVLVGSDAIFIAAAALVAPSHRTMVILLMATLSYAATFWNNELFEGFPFSLLGVPDSSPRDAYLYLGLLTSGIGVVVGGFAALRISAYLDASLRIADATVNQTRRYKGTTPYQDLDVDRKTFFGREHESRSLLSLVLAERLVVLFAKSGMGKSSLINAGLAEPLRQRQYFPIVIRLNVLSQELAQAVLDGVRQVAQNARVDIVGGEGTSVWRFFKTAEFWSEHDDLLRPVLILDQFEEIFTLHNKEVRKEFIGQLGELVRGRSGTPRSAEKPTLMGQSLDDTAPDVKVVIAIREDFLANLEELAGEIPAILHNRFRLGPLSLEAARAATIEPARVANEAFQTATFTYQEAAVERMLAFLAKRRLGDETTTSDEVEPVQLQIVCHYLEEVVQRRQATEGNDIEIQISESDLGGEEHMQQVLEGFYDRIIASVRPRRKSGAVQRLCETRLISRSGRRLTEDHEEISRRFKISEELLRHLVDARLLRAEARLGSTFYEVSHDRLVEPILQSRRKRLVQRRWVDAAAVVLVITVLGSYAYELVERKLLEREQLQLETILFSPEPEKAIDAINGLVARHHYGLPKVVEHMKTPHLNPAVLMILSMDSGRERANLTGHEGAVNFVEFSPDGQRVVSASDDGTVRVWRADRNETLAVLTGHTQPVESAAFSPDGQRVVSASDDDTARVWRADRNETLAVLTGHTQLVVSASFSPDGQRVVTASFDGTARVWRADRNETLAVLTGHHDRVRSAVFSPDGQRVVTASFDGTARVWRADRNETLAELTGHTAPVVSASFSLDGQRVVTASHDGTARVWRADRNETLAVLTGHHDLVLSAVFSPDGQRVVTASRDGTARLWYTDASGTSVVLRGHEELVRTAAFSPDGKWLASAGYDGKLILWSVEKTEPLETLSGHVGKIHHIVFSPNGETLASAGEDGTVILWNREVHKTTKSHLKEVLEHIEKHYASDLSSSASNPGGIPTLLGSLILTLDTAAKFGDPDTSKRAKRLRTNVLLAYEQRHQTKSSLDSECRRPNDMTRVTNREYRCFYPGHSLPPDEDDKPVQVNWYEALAYAAYQHTTLPNRASVDVSSSTWCVAMDIARDEKQFSLLSAPSSVKSASPCLAKGRTALLKEKRQFKVVPALPETAVQ